MSIRPVKRVVSATPEGAGGRSLLALRRLPQRAAVVRRDETGNRSLVLFDSGDEVVVQAGDEGIRFR